MSQTHRSKRIEDMKGQLKFLGRTVMSHAEMTIDVKDEGEDLQLMSAALDGQTGTVEALLSQGANVNARTHEGRTPLMFAVINMHADTVQTLLQFGAEVNAQSDLGFTPLILAACSGDARIVQALLDRGADVSKTLRSGQNALSHATEHGHNHIVELLKRAMSTKDVKPQTVTEGESLKSVLTHP
jgi:ankyrin repeat protein